MSNPEYWKKIMAMRSAKEKDAGGAIPLHTSAVAAKSPASAIASAVAADPWAKIREKQKQKEAEAKAASDLVEKEILAKAKEEKEVATVQAKPPPKSKTSETFLDIAQCASDDKAQPGAYEACGRFVTALAEWSKFTSHHNPFYSEGIMAAVKELMGRWLEKPLPPHKVATFDPSTVAKTRLRKRHCQEAQPMDMPTKLLETDREHLLDFIDRWESWAIHANECKVTDEIKPLRDIQVYAALSESPENLYADYREIVGRLVDRTVGCHTFDDFPAEREEEDQSEPEEAAAASDEDGLGDAADEPRTPPKKKKKRSEYVDSPDASPVEPPSSPIKAASAASSSAAAAAAAAAEVDADECD